MSTKRDNTPKSNLHATLTHLGLTPEAVRTYLAALDVGQAKASDIAKAARMRRTSIYPYLDELEERGLIHSVIEGKGTTYSPANPTVLATLMQEQFHEVESIIPSLLEKFSLANILHPSLRFYPGNAGIKTVLEEILACVSKEYRLFGSIYAENLTETLGEKYVIAWSERRIARGVHHRNLRAYARRNEAGTGKSLLIESGPHVLRDIRYAPEGIRLEVLTYLYDDKVAFISGRLGRQYAAVLESKDVYNSLGSVFEFIWGISQPPKKT